MRSLILQVYSKTRWVFAVLLILALAGCGRRDTAKEVVSPQVQDGLDLEVVAGRIQIGETTSNRFAGAGETFFLTIGRRISTDSAGEAELVIAGDTRLQLTPNATLELAEQSSDAFVVFRQLGGTVTFDMKTSNLSVTGSTGLGFGSGGLERVKFLVNSRAENSLFRVSVSRNSIKITVDAGEVAVVIDDESYQLQSGESLSAGSADEIEISRALTERPTSVAGAGSTKSLLQSPKTSDQPANAVAVSEVEAYGQTPATEELLPAAEAPQLLAPLNGASFSSTEIVKLSWQSEAILDQDTWFEVQLWRNDDSGFGLVSMIQEPEWQPMELLTPGDYQWQVQLIRLSDRQYLSSPSEIGQFTVIAPTATSTVSATNTPTPFPTSIPTEVIPDTPTPAAGQASYPQIVTTKPEPDKVFAFEESITLQWQSVGTLAANQWYEIRLLRNGTEWLDAFKTKEPQWAVPPEYNPGLYGWRVAVILVENGEWAGDISPESELRLFTWNAPPQPSSGDGDKGSKPPGSR